MNRKDVEKYITEQYGAEADFPWAKYPYAVFRHIGNKKWFAVVMSIPGEKLNLPGGGNIDVVNVKCDPVMTGSLRNEKGIYPAYHMDKTNWVTVAIEEAEDDKIKWLIDISRELTAPKAGKSRRFKLTEERQRK